MTTPCGKVSAFPPRRGLDPDDAVASIDVRGPRGGYVGTAAIDRKEAGDLHDQLGQLLAAGDKVRLQFEISAEQFKAVAEAGRKDRRERPGTIIYPPGIWSDEDYVRYAIQRAMSKAYPEIGDIQ